jgi:hypothetical protein
MDVDSSKSTSMTTSAVGISSVPRGMGNHQSTVCPVRAREGAAERKAAPGPEEAKRGLLAKQADSARAHPEGRP